jgi:hypothetical protein
MANKNFHLYTSSPSDGSGSKWVTVHMMDNPDEKSEFERDNPRCKYHSSRSDMTSAIKAAVAITKASRAKKAREGAADGGRI